MHQQTSRIVIPYNLVFSDLCLARNSDGSISFKWLVIAQICLASGLPATTFHNSPADNVCGLIVGWYYEHRQRGGAVDSVAQDLIEEVLAENNAGQFFSY